MKYGLGCSLWMSMRLHENVPGSRIQPIFTLQMPVPRAPSPEPTCLAESASTTATVAKRCWHLLEEKKCAIWSRLP